MADEILIYTIGGLLASGVILGVSAYGAFGNLSPFFKSTEELFATLFDVAGLYELSYIVPDNVLLNYKGTSETTWIDSNTPDFGDYNILSIQRIPETTALLSGSGFNYQTYQKWILSYGSGSERYTISYLGVADNLNAPDMVLAGKNTLPGSVSLFREAPTITGQVEEGGFCATRSFLAYISCSQYTNSYDCCGGPLYGLGAEKYKTNLRTYDHETEITYGDLDVANGIFIYTGYCSELKFPRGFKLLVRPSLSIEDEWFTLTCPKAECSGADFYDELLDAYAEESFVPKLPGQDWTVWRDYLYNPVVLELYYYCSDYRAENFRCNSPKKSTTPSGEEILFTDTCAWSEGSCYNRCSLYADEDLCETDYYCYWKKSSDSLCDENTICDYRIPITRDYDSYFSHGTENDRLQKYGSFPYEEEPLIDMFDLVRLSCEEGTSKKLTLSLFPGYTVKYFDGSNSNVCLYRRINLNTESGIDNCENEWLDTSKTDFDYSAIKENALTCCGIDTRETQKCTANYAKSNYGFVCKTGINCNDPKTASSVTELHQCAISEEGNVYYLQFNDLKGLEILNAEGEKVWEGSTTDATNLINAYTTVYTTARTFPQTAEYSAITLNILTKSDFPIPDFLNCLKKSDVLLSTDNMPADSKLLINRQLSPVYCYDTTQLLGQICRDFTLNDVDFTFNNLAIGTSGGYASEFNLAPGLGSDAAAMTSSFIETAVDKANSKITVKVNYAKSVLCESKTNPITKEELQSFASMGVTASCKTSNECCGETGEKCSTSAGIFALTTIDCGTDGKICCITI